MDVRQVTPEQEASESREVAVRRVRTLLGATATALLLVLGTTVPASAHATRMYLPDGRGYGGVTSDHKYVYACDTKADNWGVRVWYYWSPAGTTAEYFDMVGDANGSKSGCGQEYGGYVVRRFNVCAGPNGADYACTGYRYVS
jgi:hypothetical protein